MRREFAEALVAAAADDERVVLLTGDLGYMALEPFAEAYPDRFFNVGVAEQNMLGLATGLAEAGYVPFAYSIATFASMRPYEFLRNGAVLHGLPVRLVGIGGGLDYGHNGVTHYALEDIALMRAQPGLTTIVPADAAQAIAAVAATASVLGPVYLRLEKEGHPVPGLDGRFALGRAQLLGEGRDAAIVATGSCALQAVAAAEELSRLGVGVTVAVVSSFNPSPIDDLGSLFERVPLAVSVEAHYPNGALRSLVAETIATRGARCRLIGHAVEDVPRGTGTRDFMYQRSGLTAERLVESVVGALSLSAG